MHSTLSISPETNILFHKDIRFHTGLTFGEKMFLAEVQSLIEKSENKVFHYSSRSLCDLFGVSHQTILNWIRKLTELGLLEVGVDYNKTECRQYLKSKKN